MLEIKDLYKEKKNARIKALSLAIKAGEAVSLECEQETSDLLLKLILGKEVQTKGEILLFSAENKAAVKKSIRHIGIVHREEAFYENMTVESYMRFYSEILGKKMRFWEEMLQKLGLLDCCPIKIKHLTYSQKRRLALARERLKQPRLLVFQEPIFNMDRDGARIIVENLSELTANGTAILNLSVFFRDTLLLGGRAYRLEAEGLTQLENMSEDNNGTLEAPAGESPEDTKELLPTFKIEKIPARLEDRILLFDPNEIDFVESEQGASRLSIRGERFPCTLSMTELEERLRLFGFFRCHRSYLVNLQRLREVVTWSRNSYSLSLDDRQKSTIPLSKGRMEELKELLKL